MKQLFLLLSAPLIMVSCKSDEKGSCTDGIQNQNEAATDCGGVCNVCDISYPDNGFYGRNVLDDTTTHFSTSANYSMSAAVPAGSSVRVKIKLTGGSTSGMDIWFYELSTNQNLNITTYDETNDEQLFQSTGNGNIELKMTFGGASGASIEIYENGATEVSRTKNIVWS